MNADPEIVPTNTNSDFNFFVSCPITGIIIPNPLYHSIVEDNKTKAKYTIVPIGTSNNMIVRVFPEKSSTYRGIHITIILDKSGSMRTKVSETDSEMGDVTQFAVAKYAAMFIVNSLVKDEDRLTLITFDENYYVLIDYMLMNADTRKQSSDIINEIKLGNSTNFTNPIEYTINNIIRKNNSGSNTVVLLTDGIPDNPKTAVNEIKTFISGLIMPKHINFYLIGIGCNINSDILLGIANILGGNYNFIFDYTTVGTTFVNMLSNIRCITTSHAKLTLVFETDVGVKMLGSDIINRPCKNQEFDLGQLFDNQLKCCVIELGTNIPTQVKVEYFEDSCNEHETIIAQLVVPEHNIITCCLARAFVINELNNIISNLSDLSQAKKNMSNICIYITNIVSNNKKLNSTTEEYLNALLHDIKGECILALDNTKVNVWGKHHLIAFMNAHKNMECTNYKSGSLQYYTSANFEKERDKHDEIFNYLTVPVREPSRNSSQLTAVQAASYLNDRDRGCIHSHTLVKMLDGTKKKASDIKPGDKVSTGTVIYIMETIIPKGKVFMCTLPGLEGLEGLEGLRITPNHPVCSDINKKWVYPKDIIEQTDIKCDAYYSFVVMEDGNYKSYIEACGYQVLTLAHGIIGSIAEHSYLGSPRIIDDFMRCKAYLNNHCKITFIEPCFTLDPKTGWVNGLNLGKEVFPQK
jgi:hypothetical protein